MFFCWPIFWTTVHGQGPRSRAAIAVKRAYDGGDLPGRWLFGFDLEQQDEDLGALVSGYALTGDQGLRKRAIALADHLLPSFTASPTGVRYSEPLAHGVLRKTTEVSFAASGIIELGAVAVISGRLDFQQAADRAKEGLLAMGPLPPTRSDKTSVSVVGPYFETLLNAWLQGDDEDTWLAAIEAVHGTLLSQTSEWVHLMELSLENRTLHHRMSHDACKWPGLLARTFLEIPSWLSIAKSLTMTCVEAARRTRTGLAPDVINFGKSKGMWPAPTAKQGMLRPETAYSLWRMFRATRDPVYVAAGWDLFDAMAVCCKRGGKYFPIADVDSENVTLVEGPTDIGETLKYLYLLFADNETIDILPDNHWIMTKGGYPLPRRPWPAQRTSSASVFLDVPLVGRLTVGPGESIEPRLIDFVATATHAGHDLDDSDVHRFRRDLCAIESRREDPVCSGVQEPTATVVFHANFRLFSSEEELEWNTTIEEEELARIVCPPHQDPVDAVILAARKAIARGASVTRWAVREAVARLCGLRGHCTLKLAEPVVFLASPAGYVRVEPWDEPSEIVEMFARNYLLSTGTAMPREAAVEMTRWYCEKRECTRSLAADLKAPISGVVVVAECSFWEPPEFAARRLATTLNDTNIFEKALELFCEEEEEENRCGTRFDRTLRLNVWASENASVGELVCPPLREPADCVEEFVRRSQSVFGFSLPPEDVDEAMGMMMRWLCERRRCRRPLAPRVEFVFPDSSTIVAHPWDDPVRVVGKYAKKNGVAPKELREAYDSFCRERWFCGALPEDVGVTFDGVGNVTCRGFEEPADCVESFAHRALAGGHDLHSRDLQYILDLMCTQRPCNRRKLAVIATILIMHPGKTAGRALGTALTHAKNIFVLGHDVRCDPSSSQRCYLVLRHPVDRFISALAFKKQGGEWGGERLLGNICHRWLSDKTIADILDDLDGLNLYCQFANATADVSTHCIFRPLAWWLRSTQNVSYMCYDRLADDFNAMLKPHCQGPCHLRRQNPSNHTLVLGDNFSSETRRNLHAFVSRFYSTDLTLYHRHC